MKKQRPKLLDLYCGAGGAAMGYFNAGFGVIGVDSSPQPNYPFRFIQADALEFLKENYSLFDAFHASPPCQRYSLCTLNPEKHPELIDATRTILKATGKPFVIENVPKAPIRPDIMLCGSMFGLDVQRHRVFELEKFNILKVPPCDHNNWRLGRPVTVTGHGGGRVSKHSLNYKNLQHAKELMKMPWCTKRKEVTEAIPPAYTQFIGHHLIKAVK